jgi:hypothetical protein
MALEDMLSVPAEEIWRGAARGRATWIAATDSRCRCSNLPVSAIYTIVIEIAVFQI